MSEKELTVINGSGDNAITKTNNSNYGLLLKLADNLARAGDMIPLQFKGSPEKIFAALCLGDELGLKPMQSLRSICVINGKPSLYGDAQAGLVKSQIDYAGIKEWKDDKGTWHCEIKRVLKTGEIETTECEYSKNDAERNPSSKTSKAWSNNYDWMMRLRARAFACRSAYPDILSGIYNESETDEIRDAVDNGQYINNNNKSKVILEEIEPKQIEKQEPVKEQIQEIELEAFVDNTGKEVSVQLIKELRDTMKQLGYSEKDITERIINSSSYDVLIQELINEGESKSKPAKQDDMFKVPLSKDVQENQAAKKKGAK